MSHLRLFSLCNISYKIASKVLANRLKSILKYIVSESQSAFIPGRLITDNVLIAYELNHYLAHKTWGSVGHATLKLDLSKAYDCVEWSFLVRVPAKLEALSHLISTEKVNGSLCGVSVSWHGPRVSHLVFADDTLIFYQATRDAMLCVDGSSRRSRRYLTDVQVMPTFVMGCFLILTTLCLELRSFAEAKDFPLERVSSFSWDRWIPRPWKFQVIMAPNTLHLDATVDKLLNDLGGWNEALIRSFFRPEDAGLILGIAGVVPHLRIAPAVRNHINLRVGVLSGMLLFPQRTSIDQALLELFSFVGLSRVFASSCSSRTAEFQWRSSSNGFGDWNILSLALVSRLWIWRIPSSRRRRHPLIPMASIEFLQWLSYPCSVALSFRPPSLGNVLPPLALNFLSSAESRDLGSRRVPRPR
ncbi:UNVERIFIED_CONTAM: hypothetical protein Scaly_2967300 [Sesamum calycinum]|uniref:Reverse transcriptase domain-containing protein n=1 Tax=Sesamum calycinum TaxID=2727403 RepID=A0AAW2KQD4_9LAMI